VNWIELVQGRVLWRAVIRVMDPQFVTGIVMINNGDLIVIASLLSSCHVTGYLGIHKPRSNLVPENQKKVK
jgi:hypothetical protein